MFTKRIQVFKLFDFSVSVDLTWLILAVLIIWSLAVGLFPALHPDLGRSTYWSMGIVGMIGLLFSIVIHELSHSLVARRFGMPIKGITLFIFGGVAEMQEEPAGPKPEFWVAIVGPITSLLVATAFYVLTIASSAAAAPAAVAAVLGYLAVINVALAIFNMIPAFPLDGGRILRAVLWAWKGNFLWATRVATFCGSAFGMLLILLAVVSVLGGNFIGGMWWFLIGLFVRGAAQAAYQQTLTRQALHDVPVSEVMSKRPVTVHSTLPLDELVDDFFYQYRFQAFPVVDESRLVGIVGLRDLKEVPRDQWPTNSVGDVMQDRSQNNTVEPTLDAASALQHMLNSGTHRLLVADKATLLGLLSQSDILRYLAIKLNLETDTETTADGALRTARKQLAQDGR